MPRSTTMHRTLLNTIAGGSSLWTVPGPGSFAITSPLSAGTSILRCMASWTLKTTIANVSGSGELPVGMDVEDNVILCGAWTDIYNPGQIPPDIETSQSDPGWLMQGIMEYHGPAVITHGGLVQELNYNWYQSRAVKWDVERNAGPVPAGNSATVYWSWHNIVLAGQGIWDTDIGGVSTITSGTLFAQTLTKP